MLRELLAWLITPAGGHARRLGYARDGVGIQSRHRRCRAAWAGHLERCRTVIRRAAAEAPPGVAVVLGSGALLDIPLADLAARFSAVYLVDLFHPLSARRHSRRFANVFLISHDLLGLEAGAAPEAAPAHLADWRRRLPAADLVVSANLLTQLPLRPRARWPDRLDAAWATAVMAAHVADLAAGPGRACLISEFRHRTLEDGAGTEMRADVLDGLDLAPPQERWLWPLAPRGEIGRDLAVVLEVGVFSVGAAVNA